MGYREPPRHLTEHGDQIPVLECTGCIEAAELMEEEDVRMS